MAWATPSLESALLSSLLSNCSITKSAQVLPHCFPAIPSANTEYEAKQLQGRNSSPPLKYQMQTEFEHGPTVIPIPHLRLHQMQAQQRESSTFRGSRSSCTRTALSLPTTSTTRGEPHVTQHRLQMYILRLPSRENADEKEAHPMRQCTLSGQISSCTLHWALLHSSLTELQTIVLGSSVKSSQYRMQLVQPNRDQSHDSDS